MLKAKFHYIIQLASWSQTCSQLDWDQLVSWIA